MNLSRKLKALTIVAATGAAIAFAAPSASAWGLGGDTGQGNCAGYFVATNRGSNWAAAEVHGPFCMIRIEQHNASTNGWNYTDWVETPFSGGFADTAALYHNDGVHFLRACVVAMGTGSSTPQCGNWLY